MHFATNRFTFEKFPPPPPLLHPTACIAFDLSSPSVHVFPIRDEKVFFSSKRPYVSAKEPYVSAKEPCVSAKKLYVSLKAFYCLQSIITVSARVSNPWRNFFPSAKEPYVSAKEPYVSAKESYFLESF